MLNFDQIESIREEKAPLYSQYPQQLQPQPAYIYLRENGVVEADYTGEIGNARPADEWHGRTLTWRITPYLSGSAIHNLIHGDDVKPLLERVHAGHDTEWNGNNYIGTLTADAESAYEQLGRIFEEVETDIEVSDVGDWLFASCDILDHWPADKTLDEAVAELEDSIEPNWIINGDIEEALLSQAAHYVNHGREGFGDNHLAALIGQGWITEEEAQEYREETVNA